MEFRAHAARDPALNARYARAHARTLKALATVLSKLHERAGLKPAMPLGAMAELLIALGRGIVLERAANPDALPAAQLLPAVLRLLGLVRGREKRKGLRRPHRSAGPAR